MGDGNARREPGEGCPERARRVALDHQQIRRRTETREQGRRHLADVDVGVFLARAAEPQFRIDPEAELIGIEIRMLPGEHERRRYAERAKRPGDGCQFDCFRPGADDQP